MQRHNQSDELVSAPSQGAHANTEDSRAELLENARQNDRRWREARERSVRGQVRWLDTLPHRSSRGVFWSVFCGIPILLLLVDAALDDLSSGSLGQLFLTLPVAYFAAWAASLAWRAAASFGSEIIRWIVIRRARNAGVEVED